MGAPLRFGRPMTASLAGSLRVRRHPRRRPRSALPCGVSGGPRAYRVRVPIIPLLRGLGYGSDRLDFPDRLKFLQVFGPVLGDPPHDAVVPEHHADIGTRHCQM